MTMHRVVLSLPSVAEKESGRPVPNVPWKTSKEEVPAGLWTMTNGLLEHDSQNDH